MWYERRCWLSLARARRAKRQTSHDDAATVGDVSGIAPRDCAVGFCLARDRPIPEPGRFGGGGRRRGQWWDHLSRGGSFKSTRNQELGSATVKNRTEFFPLRPRTPGTSPGVCLFPAHATVHAPVGMGRTAVEAGGLCPKPRVANLALRHSGGARSRLAERTRGGPGLSAAVVDAGHDCGTSGCADARLEGSKTYRECPKKQASLGAPDRPSRERHFFWLRYTRGQARFQG